MTYNKNGLYEVILQVCKVGLREQLFCCDQEVNFADVFGHQPSNDEDFPYNVGGSFVFFSYFLKTWSYDFIARIKENTKMRQANVILLSGGTAHSGQCQCSILYNSRTM